MNTPEQFKDDIAMIIFGRSVALAKAGNQCVSCGKPADNFRDELSQREYNISQLCQTCQDDIFCPFVEPVD
jgi:hypothetical protein